MKVLVGGSSGMIGSALVEALEARGDTVFRLVRRTPQEPNEIEINLRTNAIDLPGLEGFDAVVHLGGVSIGEKRWTEREKERIWNSRIVSTEILAKSLAEVEQKPSVFVVASAVGFYGNRGDEELAENSPAGEGFLASVVKEWESATAPAKDAGIRVVNMRNGVVLSEKGGALAKQLPLFKLLLGGRLGPGTQYFSWISLRDEVDAILHVIDNDSISGPVNSVAPHEITNADYTAVLSYVINRPAIIPAPRWMLALALGGQLTDELLLASQRVVPAKLVESGFEFQDDDILTTLKELVGTRTEWPDELEESQEADDREDDDSAIVELNGKRAKPDDDHSAPT